VTCIVVCIVFLVVIDFISFIVLMLNFLMPAGSRAEIGVQSLIGLREPRPPRPRFDPPFVPLPDGAVGGAPGAGRGDAVAPSDFAGAACSPPPAVAGIGSSSRAATSAASATSPVRSK
jgi:hypothetical protein